MRTATALCIMLALSAPAFGQETPTAKLDALFSKMTAETPGCAVGVAQKGQPAIQRAYGAADLEHGVANTPSTIFESGSVAKQFTATAILLLEKDGKLKLSDDIRKYLPEMPDYKATPDYGTPITIEMLLNHTSGLRDWGSVAQASGLGRGSRSFTNAEVLDIAARQKALNYKPGAEYSYTNTGYNLAAIIVERVSGKSFQEFSRERIFTPTGMTHSQWRDDFNRVVKDRAVAYVSAAGGYRQSMPFMNVYGNGGMLTTIGDFLAWNDALAQDKLGVTKALEKKGVLNSGREIAYARGLQLSNYRGFNEVAHSGSTGGYTTWLARYPDQGLSVAMLCNGPPPGNFMLPRQIADVFLPAAAVASPAASAVIPDAADYAGTYINTSTGFPLKIGAANGGLSYVQAGIPPLPMTRVAEGKWTIGDGALPIGGAATFTAKDRFSLETNDGNVFEHKRVTPVTLTAGQLAEFTGAYSSNETGATYRISADGDSLVLKIDRAPAATLKLTPSYKDAFLAGGVLVRFYRNSAGRITEMGIADNRMRDLRAPRMK